MGAVSDLYDLAAEWLAACGDAAASAPGGPIPYAFVSPGLPALDCELLAIWAGGPVEAETSPLTPPLEPGFRTTVQGAVHLINLTACVVRCSPVGNGKQPPLATAYDLASQETLGDVWAIWNTTRKRHAAGTLFSSLHCRELFIDPAYPLPILGGIAGWQIPIRVQLDGYAGV